MVVKLQEQLPMATAVSHAGSEDEMLISLVGQAYESHPHASANAHATVPGHDDGKQDASPFGAGSGAAATARSLPLTIPGPSGPNHLIIEQQQITASSTEDVDEDSEVEEQQLSSDQDTDDDDDMDAPPSTIPHSRNPRPSSSDTPTDSAEYDSGEGDIEFSQLGFCRNCTSNLYDTWCANCGHNAEDDVVLVEHQRLASTIVELPPQAMGPVALLWDERMEAHEEGRAHPHPERPDRIRAVMARLQASGLTNQCVRVDCKEATEEQLSCVHTPELMQFVKAMALGLPPPPSYPSHLLTPDTYVNSSTYTCARLAAGGAAAVASMVASGKAMQGAAIVRPPGHHAESNMAMGFCFFNNAAVAARAAQAVGAQRVLILDWDIHHGNGTQHIFENDPSVLYMSLHRWDNGSFYPGTGSPEEVGEDEGEGYTVNVAWNGGNLHNTDYMYAFDRVLMPVARSYRPDLIIVSAGFDAADGDPIGGCRLTPECFAHMTAMLKGVAPLVLLLEGGYNLAATAQSTEACLRVLLGQSPPPLPGPPMPSRAGALGVMQALLVQQQYWPGLQQIYNDSMQQLRSNLMAPAGAATATAAVVMDKSVHDVARAAAVASATLRGVPPILAAVRGAAPPVGAATVAAKHVSMGRKRQLMHQIRKRAQQAWWRRHRRLVAARTLRANLAVPGADDINHV